MKRLHKATLIAAMMLPSVTVAEPFSASPEALSGHLSLNSNAMTCAALGHASNIIAMFAYGSNLNDPAHTEATINVVNALFERKPPKPSDMGELAAIQAFDYILAKPEMVSAILTAAQSATSKKAAQLAGYSAIASPCAVSSIVPVGDGGHYVWDIKDAMVGTYRQSL